MDKVTIEVEDLSKVSDGYHTIGELYEHRIRLFIALCRATSKGVWKSRNHDDGTPAYDGWFVLGIGKEAGDIITYHIENKYWDECNFEEVDKAFFDGHDSNEVLKRLKEW